MRHSALAWHRHLQVGAETWHQLGIASVLFGSDVTIGPGVVQVIELPIKHPELFEALGVAQPKGVLLYGPPGTGKTLLARAVAHHTDCTFIRVSGSELVQKYIGEGSRMVRQAWIHVHAVSLVSFLAGHSAACRPTITAAAGALCRDVMQLGISYLQPGCHIIVPQHQTSRA